MIRPELQYVMEMEETEVIKAKGRLKVLCRKDKWRRIRTWNLWYRTYQMGNSWRAIRDIMHIRMYSDDGNVVAVHNGIIENYQELKDKLDP